MCKPPRHPSRRPAWPGSSLSMNQGRCLSISTLHPFILSPPLPLKPPTSDTERGCLVAPTQTPGVLRVGCLHSFIDVLPRPRVIRVSAWFKPKKWGLKPTSGGVYCVWLPEATGTHQSVSTGLPLIVWMDRLTGDPEALNWTVCVIRSMHEKTFHNRWMECDVSERGTKNVRLLLV